MHLTAFPLDWPVTQSRTIALNRERSSVKTPVPTLYNALYRELTHHWRIHHKYVLISCNAKRKKDGLPTASQPKLTDTGVAVYFPYQQVGYGIGMDHYTDLAGNLKALTDMLSSFRKIGKWYSVPSLIALLSTFPTRFPFEPKAANAAYGPDHWRTVLQMPSIVTWTAVVANYNRLVKQPKAPLAQLQTALNQAKKHFNVK